VRACEGLVRPVHGLAVFYFLAAQKKKARRLSERGGPVLVCSSWCLLGVLWPAPSACLFTALRDEFLYLGYGGVENEGSSAGVLEPNANLGGVIVSDWLAG
jgi:hypothetical protein